MYKPLVSVAIITFNQKEYLRACIDSVLVQDYEPIEIVVADDGSSDGTQEMLRGFSERHPGKFVLHFSESNKGITSNSNSALALSRGKYVAWMGGDDLMLPGKIRRQVEYMEANPQCTICYHTVQIFDSSSGSVIGLTSARLRHNGNARIAVRYGSFNGGCSSMVRMNNPVTIWFDSLLPVASDWLYWVETLMEGGEIHCIDEILGRYRRHEKNITNANYGPDITQAQLDHLNSCHIIMARYPAYRPDAFYRYARILLGFRRKWPYLGTAWLSFRISPTVEAFGAIVTYVLTFGRVRL